MSVTIVAETTTAMIVYMVSAHQQPQSLRSHAYRKWKLTMTTQATNPLFTLLNMSMVILYNVMLHTTSHRTTAVTLSRGSGSGHDGRGDSCGDGTGFRRAYNG